MKFKTLEEFDAEFDVVKNIVLALCTLLEELNKADSDESPLPSGLSSSRSAFGYVQDAIYCVIYEQFDMHVQDEIEWGCGDSLYDDLKKGLMELTIEK